MNILVKANGTFTVDGVTYHKHQYIAENPLYKLNTDKESFKIVPKSERKFIVPLYTNDKYNIEPIRINAITESLREVDGKFKLHKEIAENKALYAKVMRFFFIRLGYYLIKTGYNIKIPYVKLGSLQLSQVKEKIRSTTNLELINKGRRFVNFAESKKQGKTVYEKPKHWLNGYKPFLNHIREEIKSNGKRLKIDLSVDGSYYNWNFVRSLIRPNSYNRTQNELTVMNHYRTEGYKYYIKLN